MKLFIGTSGWLYDDWVGKFYPEDLKDRDKLAFLAKHFNTVEINSTFYRMPPAKTFERWHSVVNAGFRYSVKCSRYITRTKRLVLDEESKPFIMEFLKRAALLKSRLAVILFQLPPSFKHDAKTLELFIKYIGSYSKRINMKTRFAFEFRHNSWFSDETYSILKANKAALVIADSSRYPSDKTVTSDFMYIRFHGPDVLFGSKYTQPQLNMWGDFISSQKNVRNCYVYFNNDFHCFAIGNASYLKSIFE